METARKVFGVVLFVFGVLACLFAVGSTGASGNLGPESILYPFPFPMCLQLAGIWCLISASWRVFVEKPVKDHIITGVACVLVAQWLVPVHFSGDFPSYYWAMPLALGLVISVLVFSKQASD